MDKTMFYLAIAVMTVFFTACRNDRTGDGDSYIQIIENQTSDNPFIVKAINVENGNENIACAKVISVCQSSDGEWYYLEFSAEYKNGGFELNFPATVPDECLQPVADRTVFEDVPLSDTRAKIMPFTVSAYDGAGSNIGGFDFRSNDWGIEFKYADRDFTEKGISKYNVEFDCSYKKGWNVVYQYVNGREKHTTQKPLNKHFKCSFLCYVYL